MGKKIILRTGDWRGWAENREDKPVRLTWITELWWMARRGERVKGEEVEGKWLACSDNCYIDISEVALCRPSWSQWCWVGRWRGGQCHSVLPLLSTSCLPRLLTFRQSAVTLVTLVVLSHFIYCSQLSTLPTSGQTSITNLNTPLLRFLLVCWGLCFLAI